MYKARSSGPLVAQAVIVEVPIAAGNRRAPPAGAAEMMPADCPPMNGHTYGRRMHRNDGRVVSTFVTQALLRQDITVYGDGSRTRSFCYVDDLIDGLVRLMKTPADVTGPINIGNPNEFTMVRFGGDDHGADEFALENCLPAAVSGRSEATQARHRARSFTGLRVSA
jgi:hypothetical protein